MITHNLLEQLRDKKTTAEKVAADLVENPGLAPQIMDGLSSPVAGVKFGCAKILRITSITIPQKLYPYFDEFADLLKSPNNIIKWNAIDIIAGLTKADQHNKFEKLFRFYYDLLKDESMVTAAHVIENSPMIAAAKPHLLQKISKELLKIEHIQRNSECRNILMGKAILAYDHMFDLIDDREDVLSFVKRQTANRRNATKKKAERFLEKHKTA